MSDYVRRYLDVATNVAASIDAYGVEQFAVGLSTVRESKGRVFCVGNGGGAGNASHAASDLRKLAKVQAYAFDNMSELTARINDQGWDASYVEWLKSHSIGLNDALLVFSVGGGDVHTSVNLVSASAYARYCGAGVYGILGAKGFVYDEATQAIVIDVPEEFRTPLVESFQAVIWHAVVNHPVMAGGGPSW